MNLAFDSHVPCYVDNGFCKMAFNWSSPSEEFHFLRALMKVYDVKDFASLMAIKQVAGTVKQCTFGNEVYGEHTLHDTLTHLYRNLHDDPHYWT